MSGFEWFLLVVVVILVPLVVAVAITLWTLEQARQRNRKHREVASPGDGPVKRKATRDAGSETSVAAASVGSDSHREKSGDEVGTRSPVEGTPRTLGAEPSGKQATGGVDETIRFPPGVQQADGSSLTTGSSKGTAGDGPSDQSGGSSDGGGGSADGGGGGDS